MFIFTDELSSQLDLITQKEMIELPVEAADECATAVLLVRHDEALIKAVSDQRIRLNALEERMHHVLSEPRQSAMTPDG